MRGLNRILFAGHVADRINYGQTNRGANVCTFVLASERALSRGTMTTCVKINVYIEALVEACQGKLEKGSYVVVEGELMNRDSPTGRVTEVRAWELSFFGPPQPISGGTFDEPACNSARDPEPSR